MTIACGLCWVNAVSQCLRLGVPLRVCVLFAALEIGLSMLTSSRESHSRHVAHQSECFTRVSQARGWANDILARDFLVGNLSSELESIGTGLGNGRFRLGLD